MIIRTATVEDFERLQDLYYAASERQAKIAGDYYVAAYQDEDLFVGIVELPEGDVLIAEDDGRPVGMAIVSEVARPLSPNISERRYARISSLVFDCGEARDLLMSEAELWATARGIDYLQVSLHSRDADGKKLYTGMGFAPEAELLSRSIPRVPSPLGLARDRVALFPHSLEWKMEGERTVAELKRLLPDVVKDARHVGSTSIPGIPAKPIIDIALGVYGFDKILEKQDLMREHGYYYRPSANLEEQLLFAKGSFYDGTGELQTHFIHVVELGGRAWYDYLNFRRYLIEHRDAAVKYAELKLRLARENSSDQGRERYLAGKQDFIRDTLDKALKKYHR